MRMRIIALKLEILILEVKDALDIRIDNHLRQWARLTRKLQARLVKMIQIEVCITCGMDKVTRFEAGHLRHHHGEQGV